jgi:hypothetical protein
MKSHKVSELRRITYYEAIAYPGYQAEITYEQSWFMFENNH